MKKEIAISKFKSHCLEILNNLERSQSSIIITKRNKPIATISAFSKNTSSIFGMLKNKAEIKGDIVSSLSEIWEVDK